MKVTLHLDKKTEVRSKFIPFELVLNNETYLSTFEITTIVHDALPCEEIKYTIHWNEEKPENISEDELISLLSKEII